MGRVFSSFGPAVSCPEIQIRNAIQKLATIFPLSYIKSHLNIIFNAKLLPIVLCLSGKVDRVHLTAGAVSYNRITTWKYTPRTYILYIIAWKE